MKKTIQKDSDNFWRRKLTLKVQNWHCFLGPIQLLGEKWIFTKIRSHISYLVIELTIGTFFYEILVKSFHTFYLHRFPKLENIFPFSLMARFMSFWIQLHIFCSFNVVWMFYGKFPIASQNFFDASIVHLMNYLGLAISKTFRWNTV